MIHCQFHDWRCDATDRAFTCGMRCDYDAEYNVEHSQRRSILIQHHNHIGFPHPPARHVPLVRDDTPQHPPPFFQSLESASSFPYSQFYSLSGSNSVSPIKHTTSTAHSTCHFVGITAANTSANTHRRIGPAFTGTAYLCRRIATSGSKDEV
jgi:hypothetical protein